MKQRKLLMRLLRNVMTKTAKWMAVVIVGVSFIFPYIFLLIIPLILFASPTNLPLFSARKHHTRISHKAYEQYLQTIGWKLKRKARLEFDKYKCQHCGRGVTISTAHCHHKHYKSLGNEDIVNDLLTLCWECHGKEHKSWR